MTEVNMDEVTARFARLMNNKIEVSVDGRETTIHLDGLSYGDCNRAGFLSVWCISKIIESMRLIPTVFPDFGLFQRKENLKQELESVIGVITSQHMKIKQKFYDNVFIKHPYKIVIRANHVSERSLSAQVDFVDGSTDVILGEFVRQFSFIDQKTRKLVPVPDGISAVYKQFGAKPENALKLNFAEPPNSGRFSYHIQATHSDTDHFHHVNQSVYLRYCLDCAASACANGVFHNFHGDMFAYPVREVALLHKGECFPGDKLEVQVWEDEQDIDVLHFRIVKSESVVLLSKLTFYPSIPNARL